MTDEIKIYFKDLLKVARDKIRNWFKKYGYVHYMDEDGERRHIDEMYNSVIPIFVFFDDGEDDGDTTAMDDMVS